MLRFMLNIIFFFCQECVCARLCVSLVLGAYTHSQDPGNSYLLTTAANGWQALRSLFTTGREATLNIWKGVAKLDED